MSRLVTAGQVVECRPGSCRHRVSLLFLIPHKRCRPDGGHGWNWKGWLISKYDISTFVSWVSQDFVSTSSYQTHHKQLSSGRWYLCMKDNYISMVVVMLQWNHESKQTQWHTSNTYHNRSLGQTLDVVGVDTSLFMHGHVPQVSQKNRQCYFYHTSKRALPHAHASAHSSFDSIISASFTACCIVCVWPCSMPPAYST